MGDLLRTLCRKSNLRMSIYADKGHQPKPAKHIKLLHLSGSHWILLATYLWNDSSNSIF